MIVEQPDRLDQRIAFRIAQARATAVLTLDDLAARSGVSRAMISKIERGEASPTASLLAKLTNALGFGLSALFEDELPPEANSPLLRLAEQTMWRDPDTGYVRRNVSPRGFGAAMEIVAVTLPAGKKVFFDNTAPLPLSQFIWLLKGALTMISDGSTYPMKPGDCLHMKLDKPLTFHNPGKIAADYAVVIETPRAPRIQEA